MQILSFMTCICLVIDCGDPGTPSNGTRTGSVFTFGGTVRYRCNHGYRLSGSDIRTCEASVRWSGNKAECKGRFIEENSFDIEEIIFDKKIIGQDDGPKTRLLKQNILLNSIQYCLSFICLLFNSILLIL